MIRAQDLTIRESPRPDGTVVSLTMYARSEIVLPREHLRDGVACVEKTKELLTRRAMRFVYGAIYDKLIDIQSRPLSDREQFVQAIGEALNMLPQEVR